MSKIVYKFSLAGDKFILEMNLREPGFKYNACRPFTKDKERIQRLKETGDSRYIYQTNRTKFAFSMTWFVKILTV